MPNILDNSIPIENVHCLIYFLLGRYFSISHGVIAHHLRVLIIYNYAHILLLIIMT